MCDRSGTAKGVDDARLGDVCKEVSSGGHHKESCVNSIPARHSELCRLGMDKDLNRLGRPSTIVERCQQLHVAANLNVMGGANALVWLAPRYAVAGMRLNRIARTIITRIHVEIL